MRLSLSREFFIIIIIIRNFSWMFVDEIFVSICMEKVEEERLCKKIKKQPNCYYDLFLKKELELEHGKHV